MGLEERVLTITLRSHNYGNSDEPENAQYGE